MPTLSTVHFEGVHPTNPALTVPEPCVALYCSMSTWPRAPYRHTEITSTPNTSRWGDSSLMPTLEDLQVLGKQKLQDQQTLCQVMCCHHWSIPTWIFLAYYCSLEKDMLSPPLSASHSCQNLCVSWDPSGYKTEYCWEGSPNYVMVLKAN